jgi:hypothetical protein
VKINSFKKSIMTITQSFVSMVSVFTLFFNPIELMIINAKKNIATLFIFTLIMISFFITSILSLSALLLIYFIHIHLSLICSALLVFSLNIICLIIFTCIAKSKKEKIFTF